jgi:hypothetical protein
MRRLVPMLMLALAACADSPVAPTGGESADFARIKDAEDSHGGTPFMAVMTPGQEVTTAGGDPSSSATGTTVLTLNSGQQEICFKMTWSGLSAPVSDAHIHAAPAGVGGDIVVRFAGPVYAALPAATSGTVARCVFAPRELIKAIRKDPENYYVNIHTRSVPSNPALDRPAGAIRGQMSRTEGSTVNHF